MEFQKEYFSHYRKQREEILEALGEGVNDPKAIIIIAEHGLGTSELIEEYLYPDNCYKLEVIRSIEDLVEVRNVLSEAKAINQRQDPSSKASLSRSDNLASLFIPFVSLLATIVFSGLNKGSIESVLGFLDSYLQVKDVYLYALFAIVALTFLGFFWFFITKTMNKLYPIVQRRRIRRLLAPLEAYEPDISKLKQCFAPASIREESYESLILAATSRALDEFSAEKDCAIYIKNIEPALFLELAQRINLAKIISVAYFESNETSAELYQDSICNIYESIQKDNFRFSSIIQPALKPTQIESLMLTLGVTNRRALTLLSTCSFPKYEALECNYKEYLRVLSEAEANGEVPNFSLLNVNDLGSKWLQDWKHQDQLGKHRDHWEIAVLLAQMLIALVGRCDVGMLRRYITSYLGISIPKGLNLRDALKGEPYIYITEGGVKFRAQEYIRPHYLNAKSNIPNEHNELLCNEPRGFLNFIVTEEMSKYQRLKEQPYHKTSISDFLPTLKSLSSGIVYPAQSCDFINVLHQRLDDPGVIINEILEYGANEFLTLYQWGERKAAILACNLALDVIKQGSRAFDNIELMHWYNLKARIHTCPGKYEDPSKALLWANRARDLYNQIDAAHLDYNSKLGFVDLCSTLVESFILLSEREDSDALLARTFIVFSLKQTESLLENKQDDEVLLAAYLKQLMVLYKASSTVSHYGLLYDQAYTHLNRWGINEKKIHVYAGNLDLSLTLLHFFGRRFNKSERKVDARELAVRYINLVQYATQIQSMYPRSARCVDVLWWVYKSMAFHTNTDSEALLSSIESILTRYNKKRGLVGAHHQVSPQLTFYILDRLSDAVDIERKVLGALPNRIPNEQETEHSNSNKRRIEKLLSAYEPIAQEHKEAKLFSENAVKNIQTIIHNIKSFMIQNVSEFEETTFNQPKPPLSKEQILKCEKYRSGMRPRSPETAPKTAKEKERLRARFSADRLRCSLRLWASDPEKYYELYVLDVMNFLANGFGKPMGIPGLPGWQSEKLIDAMPYKFTDAYPVLSTLVPRYKQLHVGDLLVGEVVEFNSMGLILKSGAGDKVFIPCIRDLYSPFQSNETKACVLVSSLLEGVIIKATRNGADLTQYCSNSHCHLMQILASRCAQPEGFAKEMSRINEAANHYCNLSEEQVRVALTGIDYIATMRGDSFAANVIENLFAPYKMIHKVFLRNMMLTGSKSIMVCRMNDNYYSFYSQPHVSASIRAALGLTRCIFIKEDDPNDLNIGIIEKELQTPLRDDDDGGLIIYADEVGKGMRYAQVAKNIMKRFTGTPNVRTAKVEEITF